MPRRPEYRFEVALDPDVVSVNGTARASDLGAIIATQLFFSTGGGMSVVVQAFVSPKVLRWARERANTTPVRLAKKLNTKPEAISSWESGTARPSFRQAERLAETLHIPFAYLFLSTPPDETLPLPDFRTTGNTTFTKPTPEFIDLLQDVLAKHIWYRELLQSEERAELPFVASFTPNDPPDAIAADIAATLDIADGSRTQCSSWDEFLRKLISQTQAKDILVMRSGTVAGNPHRKVSVHEFRGFAISDRFAPLIFINASDFRAAQIFTLGHELAHIWLGRTGISNESLIDPNTDSFETLCDAVAAELLVPKNAFLEHWDQSRGNIGELVRHFRVSTFVVLRRARDLGRLSQQGFLDRYRSAEKREARKQQGGSFYRTLLARNSEVFTSALIAAVTEHRELYREAARLLNVRVTTIPRIAKYLTEKHGPLVA